MSKLHPEAETRFNDIGRDLLGRVSERSSPPETAGGQASGFFVSGHLTQEDIIGEPSLALRNVRGQETAKYFVDRGRHIGLFDDDYVKLRRLAERIQGSTLYSDTLTVTTLTDILFDWIKLSHHSAGPVTELCDYIEEQAQSLVEDHELWIPIYEPAIVGGRTIAGVDFKTITEAMFEQWARSLITLSNGDEALVWKAIRQRQIKLQGRTAAVIKGRAEINRLYEIALERTERALATIRIFSPGIISPQVEVQCVPFGHEMRESDYYFTFDGYIRTFTEKLVFPLRLAWPIGQDEWRFLEERGLTWFETLMTVENPNGFQTDLINATLLYSRAALTPDPTEKLLHASVALESLLLLDESEPIQDNLGYRMAWLSGGTAAERKEILQQVKKAYALRSRYVHHGRSVDDLATMENFLIAAWTVFRNLPPNAQKFSDRREFLKVLDRKRLGA